MIKIIVLLLCIYNSQGSSSPEDIVANGSNTFAYNMYKVLSKESGNMIFCPISVHIPLSLVLQGAAGNTASELETGLGLHSDPESIRSGYRSFLQRLNGNKLKLATRLYPRVGLPIKHDFLSIAKDDFHSDVKNLDFSDPTKAAQTINDFVEEKTNNTIHDLVKPNQLDANTEMVIVNAAYFKNSWKIPFKHINHSEFYNNGQDIVNVKMMTVTNIFSYKSFPTYKVLQMLFSDDEYSMVIVLPNERNGLPELEANMPSIPDLFKELNGQSVKVTLPKFKIEKDMSLKNALDKMGMTTLFSPLADLSGIFEGVFAEVSDVIQKGFVDLNENGMSAASASAIVIEGTSGEEPMMFQADHPFLFYVCDKETILYVGRLVTIN